MTDSLSNINPEFAAGVKADAYTILADILGDEQAKQAAARIALALVALGKANPQVFECTPASVAEAVASCVASGLMVGGAAPTSYIIPRRRGIPPAKPGGEWQNVYELNWQIGFRGYLALVQRAGYQVQAFPIYPERGSPLDINGRLIIPTVRLPAVVRTLENMIGVYVHVRRLSDGTTFAEAFVEADLIEARRNVSDAYQRGIKAATENKSAKEIEKAQASPWFQWQEEQALKTAIRYVIARGVVPLDDMAQRVLEYDGKRDNVVIDVPSESVTQTREQPRQTGRAALGMDTGPGVTDFAAEAERLRKRDAIPVASEQAAPAAQEQTAKQEPAAKPAAASKPKIESIPNKGALLTRLAANGITLEMAVAHVQTPDAAWGADELRALKQLGIDVAEGRVTLDSLAVTEADPLASDPGESP